MSERPSVQDPMLKYAHEIGWAKVSQTEALRLRGGETGLYFTEVLEAQLLKLNPGIVDPARAADILRRLKLLKPSIEGNRDALAWLRGEQSVFVPEQNRERNVRLIDSPTPAPTLTLITIAAKLLRDTPGAEKPTVLASGRRGWRCSTRTAS